MAGKNRYYRRPDGLFEAIREINGKRKAFRGKTCREVDRKILEYSAEAAKGRRFPVVADEWEKEHEKKVVENTRLVYHYAVERMKAAFPQHIGEIEPRDIRRYITAFEKEGRAAGSVDIELSVCRMIFSYAVNAGDIRISPAVEIKKSRGLPVKKREALTEEQEQVVRDAGKAKEAHWWMFPYLLLYTGLRRGEALALTYGDIDRNAGVIHINKKLNYPRNCLVLEDYLKSENGQRDVPLLPQLAAVLPRNRIGLIFPGENGGPMTAYEITKNWKAFCRDVGFVELQETSSGKVKEIFTVTPHRFRHSFATICYEAGLDSRQAAKFLGDTPETVEKIYTHLRQMHEKEGTEKLLEYVAKEG